MAWRRWSPVPKGPDLLGLLRFQAGVTLAGMETFERWAAGDQSAGPDVDRFEHEADAARRKLMAALRAAFVTPLEPEDIYELSERTDDIINGAKNTVRESELMATPPDAAMADMAGHMLRSMVALGAAFAALAEDADEATAQADAAIAAQRDLERSYRQAMSSLLMHSDFVELTARRELYRRCARIGDAAVRVSERIWYSVVKEA